MSDQVTGEQVKAARALLRLTQSELSAAAGVSVRTVKKIEGQAEGGLAAVSPVYVAPVVAALRSRGVAFGINKSVSLEASE